MADPFRPETTTPTASTSSSTAPAAAAAPTAGDGGGPAKLLASWVVGDAAPANVPSHPHGHRGYADAAGIRELREEDIAREAPRSADNSTFSMLESYVGPAEPANTSHRFEPPHLQPDLGARLELGVASRAANSAFALVHSWVGAPDTERARRTGQ